MLWIHNCRLWSVQSTYLFLYSLPTAVSAQRPQNQPPPPPTGPPPMQPGQITPRMTPQSTPQLYPVTHSGRQTPQMYPATASGRQTPQMSVVPLGGGVDNQGLDNDEIRMSMVSHGSQQSLNHPVVYTPAGPGTDTMV